MRAGQTEAAVDLARLAGLYPAGVICEIMADDGTMERLEGLRAYADRHGLKLVTVKDLIAYRMRTEKLVQQNRRVRSSDDARHLEGRGVRHDHRRKHARGASDGRDRRRQGDTRSGAFGVHDGRRAALDPLRLRGAARRSDARDRARGPRRLSLPASGRARASALPTSCARTSCKTAAPTRSRRISRLGCRSTSATTASARRFSPILACARCG